MAKWDMTTAEGREAFEWFVMARMGWQRTYMLSLPGWQHEKTGRVVAGGWIYTGDGMVALKRWAAEKHGLIVVSFYDPLSEGGEATVYKRVNGRGRGVVVAEQKAADEETAIALALARALEEMEGMSHA